jgi:predicted transcriptional regulator
MTRPKPALGDLQLAIVRVLWERGEATVAEVHDALRDRQLALTTIATMLRKLEDKGTVRHREQGRQFVYSAVIAADDVQAHMVGDLVERLFDGDPLQLLSHLVREGEIDLRELDALRAEIAAAQKRSRRGGAS